MAPSGYLGRIDARTAAASAARQISVFLIAALAATAAHGTLTASPTPNTTGNYTVDWSPVSDAEWYELKESTNGGSTWSASYHVSVPTTSKSFTGKATGTYTYMLKSCKERYRFGEWVTICLGTETTTVTVNAPPPATPTGLNGPSTDYNGAYTISWNSSANSAYYQLHEKKGSGAWTQIHSWTPTSRAVSGNTAGVYYYRVRGCNSADDCSGWSASISVTVAAAPSIPGGLTGPATDYNGAYTISWNTASGSSSYRLQERFGSDSWAQIHSGSSISKAVSGRSPGTYSYRVRGCNPETCSSWSSTHVTTVAAPPAPPAGLNGPVTDYNGAYSITWNAASGAASYRLQQRFGSGSWSQIYSGSSLSKSVSGNAPGSWTYRVRSCNVESVCGTWSSIVSVSVAAPPAVPVGLSGPTTSEEGTYTLTWNTSAGSSSYQLQERVDSGSWNLIHSAPQTSKARFGQAPALYTYRVRGCNVESVCSTWSSTHAVDVPEPPPVEAWFPTGDTDFPDAAVVNPIVPEGDTGGNSVGAVNGSGGVSGGSAHYEIPIVIPPGRKGMQPDVSLTYSSNSGDGSVGIGWSLNAGSAISRCPATLVQDAFSAGVQYDSARDRLCLDGRRLVVTSGVYGVSGAQYRTELDSFARITQNGSINGTSTSFTVEFKDGRISKYGTTAASRHSTGGRAETLTWALRETHDRSGNTITYDYQPFAEGEHLLVAIHYTGINGSNGDRHVRFEYENRGDYRTRYLAGGKTRSTKRLRTVRTEYQDTLLREYSLEYGPSLSTGRSLLQSVQECAYANGATAHCLPPTEFAWQESSPDYVTERLQFSNNGSPTIVHADKRWLHDVLPHGDANGDGVKDWTNWYVNAEGEITGSHGSSLANCYKPGNSFYMTCLEVDFDADGLTDSLRRYNNQLQVRRASGSTWINTQIGWEYSSFGAADDSPLGFADFNGDGWPDLAFKQHAALYIYFHTQNVNAPYSAAYRQWVLGYNTDTHTGELTTIAQLLGDMDGNGTPDIGVSNVGGMVPGLPRPVRIVLTHSQPGGGMTTTDRTITGLEMSISVNAHFFFDVNGDGMQDLMRVNDTTHKLEYRPNDGTDFAGSYLPLNFGLPMRTGTYERAGGMENETFYMPIMSKVLVMDYDGDGRDELLVAGAVLASACSTVLPLGYRCDDELYGTYKYREDSTVNTPINSSLEDESVRSYYLRKFVEDSTGNITGVSMSSGIVASATQTAVIDATGDGLPDVVTVFGCRFASCGFNEDSLAWGGTVANPAYVEGAWINRNRGAATGSGRFEGYDLMNAAETGLGVRHEWSYRPLSSDEYDTNLSSFYETTHSYQASDPDYFHFASSMYVVADHRVTNGAGGLNSTKYRYRGAIYNNKGRGFQGFRSIISETDVFGASDPQAGTDTITRTDFHQKWPLSSQIDQACTWIATNNVADDNPACTNVLSRTTVDAIHNAPTSGDARFVAVKEQTERTYDLFSGTLLTTRTINRTFDSAGNVTAESRAHSDTYTTNLTEASTSYTLDWSNWWLNKIDSRTIRHNPVSQRHISSPTIAAGADNVKEVTTAFQYNPTHRLPSSITTTSNDSALTKTVVLQYNARGLSTLITTTGTNVTGPQTVDTTYTSNGTTESADGYFPYAITNSLGHETRREADPAHGQPIRVIDPNGLVSTTTYDAFGRPSNSTPAGSPTQYVRYFWCDVTCPPDAAYRVATYSAGAPEKRVYMDRLGREVQSSIGNFAGTSFVHVRTEYDERGNKTFESQPYDLAAAESDSIGTRYLSYDALGRLQAKEQDQANGAVFLTSYSYQGFKTSINAGGLMMHRIYNGLEQLVETQDAMGGFTRYAYDGAGNPIALQDPNGHSIVASFNALGHKVWIDDPNLGEKTFTYNAAGELLQEQDTNCSTSIGCDTIEMDYDVLGRMIERRANGDVVGRWFYDNAAADKGIGLLSYEDSGPNAAGYGLQKHYFYSAVATGRKALTSTVHRFYQGSPGSGTDYETRYYTDGYYGRPKGIRYPGGIGVAYVYNEAGYLVQEKDASSPYVLRQVTARDSRNQVLGATLADGTLTHTAEYYAATGQMKSITVTGAAGPVHALDYLYDTYGNLDSQSTAYGGTASSESFIYDDLHRLLQSSRSTPGGSTVVNYDYDPSGNLTLKDDYASALRYEGARPNAVSSLTRIGGATVSFGYDANGNLRTGDGKTLAYDAFNKPVSISAGGVTTTFAYGADLARYRQETSSGETTLYIDKLLEVVQTGAGVQYRHYLGDVALLTKAGTLSDPVPSLRFLHRDRLGSVVTVTDATGEVEARGYDPFGKPREPDWTDKTPPLLGSAVTDRGFTDHEHLDAAQLIHMNGRVYDYNLGRFLSVDPLIQAPGNSQSLNPYSYIMNNPLAGTDPSGYAMCSSLPGADEVCQIEVTKTITKTGSRIPEKVTETYTIANNGAQLFITAGADRQAFDRIEAAMVGDLSNLQDGPGLSAIPKNIGERKANGYTCAKFAMGCEDEQFLYDPTQPGPWEQALGDAVGSFRPPNSNGYRINPFTGRIVSDPIGTRLEVAFAGISLALPVPKGAGLLAKSNAAATRGAANAGDEAFHYTYNRLVKSIRRQGLRGGSYATPSGTLTPLQAQIDLALSPNRGLRDAVMRIDLAGLRQAGYQIPEVTRVGRSFGMPGGNFEMHFKYPIPSEFISVVSP